MVKRIFFLSCFLLLILSSRLATVAQGVDYGATREKIYLQTSHVFFKPGETLFFKVYVVNARTQKPTIISNTVYVDVLNPAGNLAKRIILRVKDGFAEGSYDFSEGVVGGLYRLRAYTNWMRNENETSFFEKQITVQQLIAPRVLLKLDFPKKGYGPGSEVIADFSMRNLQDQPIKLYPFSFTVSIGGKVVNNGKAESDKEGKAKLRFQLPAYLDTKDGLLNVVINYNSYTESIARSIPIALGRVDLQLLPEGGTLVSNLATRFAFRAIDEWGKPADIKGVLKSSSGEVVAHFSAYHFGMGSFPFTPQAGEDYYAEITEPSGVDQHYPLPKARAGGIVMNLVSEKNKVGLHLRSSHLQTVRLEGSFRGSVYYSRDIALQPGDNYAEVDAGLFPAGVTVFTVRENAGLPLAERLIFLNQDRQMKLTLQTDKVQYQPREKVKLSVTTTDEAGRPLPSNLSLAVLDDKLWTYADDRQDHLLSWLLLSSELRGKIEEPLFYFRKDEPLAAGTLDLVMLTHGYRYFDYIGEVARTGELKFEPDQNHQLEGKTCDRKGIGVPSRIYLIDYVTNRGVTAYTDSMGHFVFNHLEPAKTYYLLAQSLRPDKSIAIIMSTPGNGLSQMRRDGYGLRLNAESRYTAFGVAKFTSAEIAEPAPPVLLPGKQTANLAEVVVTGYGVSLKREVTGSLAAIAAKEFAAAGNLAQALEGRAAGLHIVQVGNPGADPMIRIRGYRSLAGSGQPLFVVNGTIVEQAEIALLQPAEILRVTVLKDAAAALHYCSRAANGVIQIETSVPRNEKWRITLGGYHPIATQPVSIAGPVYSAVRRFYAPRYEEMSTESRTDFRETIYWNPVVQTDGNGKAELEFFNSDAVTTFRIQAEGLGWNGMAGRNELTYSTKNLLTADVKIPPYLTVGDQAQLPLFLKNNTSEAKSVTVSVTAPRELRIGSYNHTITLGADSSAKLLIPLEATTAFSGKLLIKVSADQRVETLALPITVAAKGFPVQRHYSGNHTQQHHFSLRNPIPGSVTASLRIFASPEGQLLDGIESMLREPHGCFEQTSSTTYPNVFILKYLKQSGKSRPEIETKAMEYIRQGYQRLVGFETSENGFEWFGHAPAHAALTAYGLLEFTDMKEFVSVDERMLERTKKFLLGRRDGKGGFGLSRRGYDQFASVPDQIADVYIVYALTQCGIGNEIDREYRVALSKTLQSGDGYLLAMMALAASSMKDEKNFALLMQELGRLYDLPACGATTSVVNSRDASLRVETASLYALALMRPASPDFGKVATLIDRILREKSYYGYGSTQATVLALKAIVEFSRFLSRDAEEMKMEFVLNGKTVKQGGPVSGLSMTGENQFEVKYLDPSQAIPYSFELSYQTYLPPNSDQAELSIATRLSANSAVVGESLRMDIEVTNLRDTLQAMAIAKIGIPAGLAAQPWQLKELLEKKQAAYYEIFDNYLVIYWMGMTARETKSIHLDLKAEVPGTYTAKASTAYLYYMPEHKRWEEGTRVEIR